MSAQSRKILRDFVSESARSLVVIFAIAVGIAGFTAVLASYAILTRELNKGYLATNPASFTIRTDDANDEVIRAALANPNVSDAEARRTMGGRVRIGNKPWRSLTLFVVKDYGNIRVSTLQREHGAWPPGPGEMLIERDAFQVIGARIGDSVTVKTPNGAEQQLRVTGSVHDVGRAQARMENAVYGYITTETLSRLGEQPVLNQINVLVARNRFDEPFIRRVADETRKRIEDAGHPVLRVDVPEPGKHPHADLMGMLLLAKAAFGIFVMLLSGIIVVNLLTGLMAAQVRQIGIMKTIGATRGQIARLYFAQALLYGAGAVVIALPIGIAGSRALCKYQSIFLNFDITSYAIPGWVFAAVAVVGLIVPLVAAAVPVWRGSGVSIRQAIHDYGISQKSFGSSFVDRMLARVGGFSRPLLLSIRNSFRRRGRLAMTVITLTIGGLFFMSALNVRVSMINTLDVLFASKRFDLSVAFRSMVEWDEVKKVIEKTPGIVRSEGWISTQAAPANATERPAAAMAHGGGAPAMHGGGGIATDSFTVFALPIGSRYIDFNITEGRGFKAGDVDVMIVNGGLVRKYQQMRAGSLVPLKMGPAVVTFRIIGVAREAFSPPTAYVPAAFFESRGHTGATNSVRVVLQKTDAESIERVKTDLERNLVAAGLPPQALVSKGENRYGFDQHMVMIYVFLVIMSAMLAGVGGLGLMTTMSLNVLERRREMGVLRAIGATPGRVAAMLVAEGVVVAIGSWILAAIGAAPVSRAIGNLLTKLMFQSGLDFKFEASGLAIWLAVAVALGALSSLVPALDASRKSVREALGYE
jgi:putative ABC transport system permease protein